MQAKLQSCNNTVFGPMRWALRIFLFFGMVFLVRDM